MKNTTLETEIFRIERKINATRTKERLTALLHFLGTDDFPFNKKIVFVFEVVLILP